MKLMVASVVVDSVFVCKDDDDVKRLGRLYLQREVTEGAGLFYDCDSQMSLREIEDEEDIPPGWKAGNVWGAEDILGVESTTVVALDLISKEKLKQRIMSLEKEIESLKGQLNERI